MLNQERLTSLVRTRVVRIGAASLATAIALGLLQAPARVASPRFFPDDPIARVPETQDASGVQEFERSLTYDILINSFASPGDRRLTRARNVNTIDEVPDSQWFTNRIVGGRAEDVARGPDTSDGPADGRWTIVRSKSEGMTPGFTVRDERGVLWFLKFDPPGSPELASGAEVVSTNLFHAAGYFVPENHIATLRRDRLVVGRDARIKAGGAPARPMAERDIDRLLRRAQRNADGTYRVLASRALAGRPVGAFSYYGRRSDDPNDIVHHEHRRELRGLRVMAAWTQHVDTKGGNTLDTVVEEGGRRLVRHHLIDLGSTLGSAGIGPRAFNEGHESLVEPDLLWRGIVGFGFFVRPWRTIPYPALPSVGRFEGEHFDPDAWVPSIPNAAFLRARPDDLFWGARRVMAFSDAMIRAAVHAGRYSDAEAERHLAAALIARRNRIGRAWLPIVNPIVDPHLDTEGRLQFVNAAVAAGVSSEPAGGYHAVWSTFDNATGETTKLGESASRAPDTTFSRSESGTGPDPGSGDDSGDASESQSLAPVSGSPALIAPVPLPRDSRAHLRIDVHAVSPPHRSWSVPVELYFRRDASGWRLVGLERQP